MADRRGRDADFTGTSPDSNASPTRASPVSPDRPSQPAADFAPNTQRYSQTAHPEQAMAAYVVNPQPPATAPGLGIQQGAAPAAVAAAGAERPLRVRIISNPSPGGAAAGSGSRPSSAEEGTYSTAHTYYDPGPTGYGLDDDDHDDDAPRRYQRGPAYQPVPDPGLAPSIGITRSYGAESIRSTQSRRSKYDSEWALGWNSLTPQMPSTPINARRTGSSDKADSTGCRYRSSCWLSFQPSSPVYSWSSA